MPIRPWFAAALLLGLALPPSVAARAEDEEPPKGEGADPAPAPDDAGEPVADLKKEFPKANLAWTLPAPPSEAEKPRWQWSSPGNQSLGKGDKGDLASAAFGVSDTLIAVEVSILPAMPGAVVEAFINEQSNLDNINKNFDPVPTPQTVLEMEIGNWRGGAIVATGKNASTQKPLQIRWYLVVLKGIVYVINLAAHENAEKEHNAAIQAFLKGLHWIDTNEGVRGPLGTSEQLPFESHTEPRGKDEGKDAKIDRGLLKLRKPAAFAELPRTSPQNPQLFRDWMFAAEARKDKAYAFVGVVRFPPKKAQNDREPPNPETLIDELEGEWKNWTTDPVTRKSEKAPNKSPTSFKGGKGFEYTFKGTAFGAPYEEKGIVVKDGGAVWWIRAQTAGKNAQALASDVKSLVGSVTFGK